MTALLNKSNSLKSVVRPSVHPFVCSSVWKIRYGPGARKALNFTDVFILLLNEGGCGTENYENTER